MVTVKGGVLTLNMTHEMLMLIVGDAWPLVARQRFSLHRNSSVFNSVHFRLEQQYQQIETERLFLCEQGAFLYNKGNLNLSGGSFRGHIFREENAVLM